MTWNVALLVAVLSAYAPGQQSEEVVVPKLERGQELVFRGTFEEEAARPGIRFRRTYDYEGRWFVLDRDATGYDLAALTVFYSREAQNRAAELPVSINLERVRLDLQGRMSASDLVPIDGVPAIERGMFFELPQGRLGVGKHWDTPQDPRPPRGWRVGALVSYRGASCYPITVTQQSEQWGRATTPELPGWKRIDTLHVSALNGYASAVERLIEIQDPSAQQANSRYHLKYQFDGKLHYAGALGEERRAEILEHLALAKSFDPTNRATTELIVARVQRWTQNHPATPYREALLALQRRADAANRNDTPPVPMPLQATLMPETPRVGNRLPEFLTRDLLTREQVRLSRLRGKPLVVLYLNAEAASAMPTLEFLQKLQTHFGTHATMIGIVMEGDIEAVKRLHKRLNLTIPLLEGTAVRKTHQIDTTPLFVVVDANGGTQAVIVGWGGETSGLVWRELDRRIER